MTDSPLSRRALLSGGLGSLALVAAGPTLAGCSTTAGSGSHGSSANAAVKLPKYIRYRGATPDLPGTDDGIPDVFSTYPANPRPVTTGVPADGSPIAASVQINAAIPPGLDRNAYWKELDKRLGAKLDLTITPYADYAQRFATAGAGDDLGDMFTLDPGLAQLPQFLEAKCQDLTEFVSGDAVTKYPFLANIPTDSWRGCVFNGGIYALPIPRGVQTSVILYTRKDLFDGRGVDPNPRTADEFLAVCRQMTDPRANAWALTSVPMPVVQQMVGLPNGWQVKGGAFRNALELPGYKDALEMGRRLVAEQLVHPDSADAPVADQKTWFGAGSAAIHQDTYSATAGLYQQNAAGLKEYAVGLMVAPGVDGAPAKLWLGPPNNTISAVKKASPDRIRVLLSVLNWMAAPFGSEEHLFRKFGIKGVDYELNGTDPVLTPTGQSETAGGGFPIQYLVEGPLANYFPGRPDIAKSVYDNMRATIPTAVRNPTVGLYSDTQGTRGGQLNTVLTDATNSILLGRQPVSSWDTVARNWRNSGGDTIRTEYEKAYKANDA